MRALPLHPRLYEIIGYGLEVLYGVRSTEHSITINLICTIISDVPAPTPSDIPSRQGTYFAKVAQWVL